MPIFYLLFFIIVKNGFHYLFECPLFIIQRNKLLLDTVFLPSLTLNVILNGDENLSTQDNIQLHESVSTYITQTQRF